MTDPDAPPPPSAPDDSSDDDGDLGDAGSLVVEDSGFAIVGDWVINAEISDAAFRVYSLLLRFGGSSGCRMPSRSLLARRLHRSVDSIDRALRELVDHGIVRVEHRHVGRKTMSNRYHVRTSAPGPLATQMRGRTFAAPAEAPSDRGRSFQPSLDAMKERGLRSLWVRPGEMLVGSAHNHDSKGGPCERRLRRVAGRRDRPAPPAFGAGANDRVW
jgi:Helix-turn-helix domain